MQIKKRSPSDPDSSECVTRPKEKTSMTIAMTSRRWGHRGPHFERRCPSRAQYADTRAPLSLLSFSLSRPSENYGKFRPLDNLAAVAAAAADAATALPMANGQIVAAVRFGRSVLFLRVYLCRRRCEVGWFRKLWCQTEFSELLIVNG